MIEVGHPFSRPLDEIVNSLQTSLLLGVEQPATVEIVVLKDTLRYPIRSALGPVSSLAAQITGFVPLVRAAGTPAPSGSTAAQLEAAVFNLGEHYTYATGQLILLPPPVDADEEVLQTWAPAPGSVLTVGYNYREQPSGITDFNPGSVAGTLVRAVSRELKLIYEQMDQAYRRSFIDHAQGVALDNVVALLAISRNQAQAARGKVSFMLKKAPRVDIPIAVGTRVADTRGRVFKVTEAGVIPAVVEETLQAAATTLTAGQPIAALVHVRVRGTTADLAVVPGAAPLPFGENLRTVTLATAPAPGTTLVLSYQARNPSVTVPVVALDTGPQGNLGAGSLTVMPTPPRGVDGGVTNHEPTTGGSDPESDDELRDRAKHSLETAGKATLNALRFAVLDVDGVDSVEVHDHGSDPTLALGLVAVRYAISVPDDQADELDRQVAAAVEATRSAGIKVRASRVTTLRLSGNIVVLPAEGGAAANSGARYLAAVLADLSSQAIGQSVSPRKIASRAFQVPGLADVAEVQLDYVRSNPPTPLTPLTGDPFLVGADEHARPDKDAIHIVVLGDLQLVAPIRLSRSSGSLSCSLRLLDDQGAPVRFRQLSLSLTASVLGRPANAPSQEPGQIVQLSGSLTLTGTDTAAAVFTPLAAELRTKLDGLAADQTRLLVQVPAYPGLQGASAALQITP
ncbi:MAG: hypothetical protein RL722_961 [Pseudomonadota bacterium]|jgi:uncharacterized phage protein gp47/JayE